MRLTLGERSAIGVPAAMKKKGALTFPGVGIERGSGGSMHRMRILSPNQKNGTAEKKQSDEELHNCGRRCLEIIAGLRSGNL